MRSRDRDRGFTLIEILVVLAIIGIIVALVVVRIRGGAASAKQKLTLISIRQVAASIDRFSLDVGHAPERLEDLVKRPTGAPGWSGPYVEAGDLKDAWGRPLVYRYPGDHREFDLLSYGADGKPGGEGPAAEDVLGWTPAAPVRE